MGLVGRFFLLVVVDFRRLVGVLVVLVVVEGHRMLVERVVLGVVEGALLRLRIRVVLEGQEEGEEVLLGRNPDEVVGETLQVPLVLFHIQEVQGMVLGVGGMEVEGTSFALQGLHILRHLGPQPLPL